MKTTTFENMYKEAHKTVLGYMFSICIILILCMFVYQYVQSNVYYEIQENQNGQIITYTTNQLFYTDDGSVTFIDRDDGKFVTIKECWSIKRKY